MPRSNFPSLLAGFLSTPALVLAGFLSLPQRSDVEGFESAAWMWSASQAPLKQIPLAEPIHGPSLKRGAGEALYAVAGSRTGSPREMAQPAQRYDEATQRFVAASEPPEAEPLAKLPEGYPPAQLLPGDARLWLEENPYGERHATFFQRGDRWLEGPTLVGAPRGEKLQAMALGSRTAVLSEARRLYIADANDALFREIPLHGDLWEGLIFIAGVAGDGMRLDVVMGSYGTVSTHIIDTDSGATTRGPDFAIPRDAANIWKLSAGWAPGGGVLMIGNGMYTRLDHPLANRIAPLAILLLLVALGFGFAKKLLRPGSLIAGLLLGGLVPAGAAIWVLLHVHR